MKNFKKALSDALNSISDKKILAISTGPETASSITESLLEHLVAKLKMKGVFIVYSVPAETLFSGMKNGKFYLSNLAVVDAAGAKSQAAKSKNIYSMQGPSSLTELSIYITKFTDTGKYGFIYIDSLSALGKYNSFETSERFVQYLVRKLRSMKISGQLLFLHDEAAEKLLAVAVPLVDRHIVAK
jgi:hypothetical protein